MRYKTLERITEWLTIALLILAGVVGLLVAVLDLWGVDYSGGPWAWLKGSQPITLLTVALLAVSLGLERLLFFKRVEESLAEINLKLNRELDVKQIWKLFDENLVRVFGKRVSRLLKQVDMARLEKTITLEGKDDIEHWFPVFYIETLKAFPKSLFVATSLPYPQYFWRHEHVMEEIKRFTERGSMERIFFLYRESDLKKAHVNNILLKHADCGVKVYVTDVSKFPEHLKGVENEFILVDYDGNIGWHAEVRDRKIVKVKATADKEKTRKYIDFFDEIKTLGSTKEFVVEQFRGSDVEAR